MKCQISVADALLTPKWWSTHMCVTGVFYPVRPTHMCVDRVFPPKFLKQRKLFPETFFEFFFKLSGKNIIIAKFCPRHFWKKIENLGKKWKKSFIAIEPAKCALRLISKTEKIIHALGVKDSISGRDEWQFWTHRSTVYLECKKHVWVIFPLSWPQHKWKNLDPTIKLFPSFCAQPFKEIKIA